MVHPIITTISLAGFAGLCSLAALHEYRKHHWVRMTLAIVLGLPSLAAFLLLLGSIYLSTFYGD